jgi:hypothetical protein
VFSESKLFDKEDRLCAVATATWMLLADWGGVRRPNRPRTLGTYPAHGKDRPRRPNRRLHRKGERP